MAGIASFLIETQELTFTGTDTMTITYLNVYTSTPKISAVSVDGSGVLDANINVYVENVMLTQATIRLSTITNAKVHVQIIGT
jgi:hypothetical protein